MVMQQTFTQNDVRDNNNIVAMEIVFITFLCMNGWIDGLLKLLKNIANVLFFI